MIRIVLAEDQSMLRGALSTLLNLEKDIEVMATAENGRQALELIRELNPDVLVTDIEMPEMSGIDLANALTKEGINTCLLYTSPSPRDLSTSRMPSSA